MSRSILHFTSLVMPAVAMLSFISATSANAQILTKSFTADTGAPGDIPVSYTFDVSKFDTNLGTLTGVSITLTAWTGGQLEVLNFTNSGQDFTNATATMPVTVTGPGNTSLAVTLEKSGVSGHVDAATASGPGIFTSTIPHVIQSDTKTLTSNLSMWEGGPSDDIQLSVNFASSGTSASGDGLQVFFSGSAAGSAKTTITYTYDSSTGIVPEPGTVALAALGLIALFVGRKSMLRLARK